MVTAAVGRQCAGIFPVIGTRGQGEPASGGQWALLATLVSLGLIFPDLDHLSFAVLGHRSILTHSLLLPALLWAFWLLLRMVGNGQLAHRALPARDFSWALGWLLLGLAIHLFADLHPKGWQGFALAKYPKLPLGTGTHQVSEHVTKAWLWVNTVVAVLLVEWLLYFETRRVTAARHVVSVTALALCIIMNERKLQLLPDAILGWIVLVILARLAAYVVLRIRDGNRNPARARLGAGG